MLGAMSGTSADGVDVAAVAITGRGLEMTARYLAHVERPYDADLRRRIFAVREGGAVRLDELANLGRDITLAYAAATRDLLAETSLQPAALAAHGQTLYHAPPNTIQWLDPSLLAAETGLAVVSDFRRADCAAGGQGAPLVPFADWILFRSSTKTRVILNLGGIANLTYLPAGGGIEDVVAFDTGPGNCLSDQIVRTRGEGLFDIGGNLAADGTGSGVWSVEWMEEQEYATRPPPKSTDVPEVLAAYEAFRASRIHPGGFPTLADELATAAEIVAQSVAEQIFLFTSANHAGEIDVFVGGGGTQNATLMSVLQRVLPTFLSNVNRFESVDEAGVPSQAREAVCFAVLGAATLDGEAGNVPNATGAARRVVLGSVTPRPLGLKIALGSVDVVE